MDWMGRMGRIGRIRSLRARSTRSADGRHRADRLGLTPSARTPTMTRAQRRCASRLQADVEVDAWMSGRSRRTRPARGEVAAVHPVQVHSGSTSATLGLLRHHRGTITEAKRHRSPGWLSRAHFAVVHPGRPRCRSCEPRGDGAGYGVVVAHHEAVVTAGAPSPAEVVWRRSSEDFGRRQRLNIVGAQHPLTANDRVGGGSQHLRSGLSGRSGESRYRTSRVLQISR